MLPRRAEHGIAATILCTHRIHVSVSRVWMLDRDQLNAEVAEINATSLSRSKRGHKAAVGKRWCLPETRGLQTLEPNVCVRYTASTDRCAHLGGLSGILEIAAAGDGAVADMDYVDVIGCVLAPGRLETQMQMPGDRDHPVAGQKVILAELVDIDVVRDVVEKQPAFLAPDETPRERDDGRIKIFDHAISRRQFEHADEINGMNHVAERLRSRRGRIRHRMQSS